MSTKTLLADLLKSATTVADSGGKSVLVTDGNGSLNRISAFGMHGKNLYGTEEPKYEMPLKDFIQKYVEGRSPGFVMIDQNYQNAAKWYVKLTDDVKFCTQDCLVFVTKAMGSVTKAWSFLSFMVFPVGTTKVYSVYYATEEVITKVKQQVYVLNMTAL